MKRFRTLLKFLLDFFQKIVYLLKYKYYNMKNKTSKVLNIFEV